LSRTSVTDRRRFSLPRMMILAEPYGILNDREIAAPSSISEMVLMACSWSSGILVAFVVPAGGAGRVGLREWLGADRTGAVSVDAASAVGFIRRVRHTVTLSVVWGFAIRHM
jgi:hypothetical protein